MNKRQRATYRVDIKVTPMHTIEFSSIPLQQLHIRKYVDYKTVLMSKQLDLKAENAGLDNTPGMPAQEKGRGQDLS